MAEFSGIGGWEIKDQDWRDSKQGINDAITALEQTVANFGSYAVVASTGDVSDPNTKTIYLVKDTTQTGTDKYQEYICTDTTTSPATFELIGDTTVDLSQYYTKTETSSVSELSTEFGNKLDSSVAASTYLTQASADTLYQPIGDYATTSTVDSISTDVGTLKTASSTWNNVTNKLDSTAAFTKSSADTLYAPIGTTASITSVTTNNYISGNGTNSSPLGLNNTISAQEITGYKIFMTRNDVSSNLRGDTLRMTDPQNDLTINVDKIIVSKNGVVVSISWYDLISYVTAHM
jgi:hypothetical protein